MHGLARLIVLAALAAGCGSKPAPPRERAGLDGLRDHLEAARRGAVEPDWKLFPAEWDALVTAPYRRYYGTYAVAFVEPALGPGAITTRWQYADDRAADPERRRERLALPVGRPGALAAIDGRDLPAVFVFADGHWRALVNVDLIVQSKLAERDPRCLVAYAAAAEGACMDAAAPVAIAALAEDDGALRPACARIIALGCGSVAAPP